ncbi:hypothetical protein ANA_C10566 [Anabaena sp. 90]|uniref:Tic22 family protein n=1 Tax=Anabaena sp. 90 TaxID=46234 RepID=UPI00029B5A07|nr:Tic22 family protein [Anabaena sp. 90]AFW93366.1 hypothetical protein ANA_C10566 [Anabaena sp. 90]
MKLLVRWSLTLGLAGSTFLGVVLVPHIPALALPEQEIKAKLDGVPVYLVTNGKGIPLSRSLSNNQNGQKDGDLLTRVYMSRQEAQEFIKKLQQVKDKNPKLDEVVKTLQVTAVPLGSIYQQIRETKNQPNRLIFDFKPVDRDIQGALDLLRQSGQKVDKFSGLPVFAVRFGADKGYVPIQTAAEKQQLIPLFLSKQDAQGLLTQVKPKYRTADIQVIAVDEVIKTLQSKNDDWLKQVLLVPSPESREYMMSREYIKTLPNNKPSQK